MYPKWARIRRPPRIWDEKEVIWTNIQPFRGASLNHTDTN